VILGAGVVVVVPAMAKEEEVEEEVVEEEVPGRVIPKAKSRSMGWSAGRALSCAVVMYSAREAGYHIFRIRPGITGTMEPRVVVSEWSNRNGIVVWSFDSRWNGRIERLWGHIGTLFEA
jgi:hypothetical protein